MQLTSINLGKARQLPVGRKLKTTGIYKTATDEPVEVSFSGLVGDSICDPDHHGGPDQAVYVYGQSDYDWWAHELHREMRPGIFGENLTISELESGKFFIGDRLLIGSVMLEVTAPRIPCATLAARMGAPDFVRHFRQAERPGLYCRVIRPDRLKVGMEVHYEKYGGSDLPVLEVFRSHYDKAKSEATLRRFLNAPIAMRERAELEELLKTAGGQA